MDVTSLYTNIPHKDGIDARRQFLETCDYQGKLSTENLCKLVEVVLTNNFFQFDGQTFLQKMGTAMGSPMAPAFAALFMGKLEQDFLDTCEFKPEMWLRFLDDIFMLWCHSLDDLQKFVDSLNAFHPDIKFTYTVSDTAVTFLDVNVSIDDNNNIHTAVHEKPTNIHQYVEYSSCHPRSCKNGIPLSQAKRCRRICSDDEQFSSSLSELRKYFKIRNYPESVINSAFDRVKDLAQSDALKPSVKDNKSKIIPFVIEFNPSLPNIGEIINKYWDLLKLSNNVAVRALHEYRPVVAFKRPKNIKDFLVTTKYQYSCNTSFMSHKCTLL